MTLPSHSRRRPQRPHRSLVLKVETLEDRSVPATFTVMNKLDSGVGSLRQAIIDANTQGGADTIDFAASVTGTIKLTTGQLSITDDLAISGPVDREIAVSGNNASRVLDIAASTTVSITELTITRGLANGAASGFASSGGGILNQGDLTLDHVVLSYNRAVGDPNVVIPVNPVFNVAGGAIGGALANFGSLTITDSTFSNNQALGADNTNVSGSSFPGPAFPGNGLGGAIYNSASASITDSLFSGNLARAGNGGQGDFAAIGGGGAITNDTDLTIVGSTFRQNQAFGGNNAISPFHNGHALGGAINSGSLEPLIGAAGATLAIDQSTFTHNQAIGGNDNQVTMPPGSIPRADGPNNAYGGGILVFQGTALIGQSTIAHNRAVAGAGGAAQNGSIAVGGGIFFFNFLGGVTATVEDSSIHHNGATGGLGRVGEAGGDGLGGGIGAGGLGAPFGAPGTITVTNTSLTHNFARGGNGGGGGNGGNGLGGGTYNDADSTFTLTEGTITYNQAKRGLGTGGGVHGLGIGGGVYNLGTFSFDFLSLIANNHADTSNNNFFP